MGASIFSEIVSEALNQAGDTSLTVRMNFVLKKWLRSQAMAFLWPQLRTDVNVAVEGGISGGSFGSGSGGVTEEVRRICDPMKIYYGSGPTLTDHANIRVQTDWDDALVNAAAEIGKPDAVRVKELTSTKGRWSLAFNRTTDKAYTIQVKYYFTPVDPATTEVPWYANDRTMVQAVFTEALKYKKDTSYRDELALLATMVMQDRLSEGIKPGVHDSGIQLSRRYFKGRQP